MTTRPRPRITARQMDKEDRNSWAVLIGGVPVEDLQDLSRKDAAFYRDRLKQQRMERDAPQRVDELT